MKCTPTARTHLKRRWRYAGYFHVKADDFQLFAEGLGSVAGSLPGVATGGENLWYLLLDGSDGVDGGLGILFDGVMHNAGVGRVALNHVAQEFDAEDNVARFVAGDGGEACAEGREEVQ